MVDRWNIDNDLMDITAAILNATPINPIHPDFVTASPANQKRKYDVKKGGIYTTCETNDSFKMYCYSSGVKDSNHANHQYKCEHFVVVGMVRTENQFVKDFYSTKSKITQLFGYEGMSYVYDSLVFEEGTLANVRLGDLGVSGVSIQNTSDVMKDKCGISKFEIMVKYVLYFSHS